MRATSVRSRVAGSVVTLACALALVACSSDDTSEPDADSDAGADATAPVKVSEGEEFTWNDFTVEDGWKIRGVQRSIEISEEILTPEVSGTIVNNSAEERAAIFQMVFSVEGDAVARVNCTAPKMVEDQSMAFLCPGINTTMPADYDTLTVMEVERDSGTSDSDDSGT